MRRKLICEGQTEKIVPYTRKGGNGRQGWTPQLKKYYASQEMLAKHLFIRWSVPRGHNLQRILAGFALHKMAKTDPFEQFKNAPLIDVPYRFGLAIGAPVVKSGPRKGMLPVNKGDHDNYTKAFLDAAQVCHLVPDDSLHWYRGPCDARQDLESGVYISDEWAFLWRFELAETASRLEVTS